MTRTGASARLATHLAEPFVEIHPQDADAAGLVDGGFASISTAHGSCILKVMVSESQQPGSLFVPIHWSAETASSARVGDLVAPCTDPLSGQPEAKATPAAIAPVDFASRGFTRTRQRPLLPEGTWWVKVALAEGTEYRFATSQGPLIWHDFAYRTLGPEGHLAEQLEGGVYRAAAFRDGEVEGYVCVGPAESAPQWDIRSLMSLAPEESSPRRMPGNTASAYYIVETEPVVCACFGVGIDAVRQAVNRGEAKTVADIGRALRAGTNCGSCLPELKRILLNERLAHTD
jgi:assimilatory nitrate reductase catalytic subunit